MAKIYAIRESGMSPKDIPTKGYNNENINPAKKMSCAGGVLAGRALPRGKLKTIHRNDTGIGNVPCSLILGRFRLKINLIL